MVATLPRANGGRFNPYRYLVNVLQRVGKHPAARVSEPTPRRRKTLFADNPLRSDLHRSVCKRKNSGAVHSKSSGTMLESTPNQNRSHQLAPGSVSCVTAFPLSSVIQRRASLFGSYSRRTTLNE